ncbi:MAG: hypothetical protein R2909_14985 [Gemmatimonadales bacterium]
MRTVTVEAENARRSETIWLAPSDGVADPITSLGSSATSPRWSPDGSTLAFVSAGP